MLRLLKSKKGTNDVTLLWTIISVLVLLGVVVPLIQDAYSDESTSYDVESVTDNVGDTLPDSSTSSVLASGVDILVSVFTMFFWSFDIHWIINLLLLEPMRIIFYILIYRQVRGGSG